MSNEAPEKKQYPSQLNSKTISARVPVQDYVNFLNESIDLGISLNDFLLRKIYNNIDDDIGFTENREKIVITKDDFISYSQDGNNIYEYFKDDFEKGLEFKLSKEDLISLFDAVKRKQDLIDLYSKKKVASLEDVKFQLSILINNRYSSNKERQSFRKDIYELIDELS